MLLVTSFPGSARERAARQALPAVNDFIEEFTGIRGRASMVVRSQAEPGNETTTDDSVEDLWTMSRRTRHN